jgi:hypothetical protein
VYIPSRHQGDLKSFAQADHIPELLIVVCISMQLYTNPATPWKALCQPLTLFHLTAHAWNPDSQNAVVIAIEIYPAEFVLSFRAAAAPVCDERADPLVANQVLSKQNELGAVG